MDLISAASSRRRIILHTSDLDLDGEFTLLGIEEQRSESGESGQRELRSLRMRFARG